MTIRRSTDEHTRALVAPAKELECAVILPYQLSREWEKRTYKRRIMSDLAMSNSIEQDAANIIFLYRDEVYNSDTPDKGNCELNSIKQRQEEPGVIVLRYVGSQTRFDDLEYQWQPRRAEERAPRNAKGFA